MTNVREIKGATDRLYPYYYGEPQTNVVQLMDMSSNCDGDDYCECHGARAGLSRRLREEHASHVQTLANVKPFKDVDIDSFLAWDCYIFASFAVDSENGVIGCINRLKDIGCFESSWTWNFVVLYPTKPSKEQIEETEWLFKCLEEDQWAQSVCGVAFGEDETVKGVKVLGTRYFRDHWPTDEDWKDMSRGEDESLEELKEYFSSCCDNVKQKRDQTLSNIINQNDNEGDLEENWNLKHEKLEFMLSLGAVISNCAVFDLIHSIDYRGKEERKSVLKTLSWLLEHGANVNGVRHGQSSLDCLSKSLLTDVCKFEDLESFRGLLLAHGGKNAFELRTEECRKRGVEPVIFFTDN